MNRDLFRLVIVTGFQVLAKAVEKMFDKITEWERRKRDDKRRDSEDD